VPLTGPATYSTSETRPALTETLALGAERALRLPSPLADVAAEHWLHVDHRRPVHRLEVAHLGSATVDRHDLHPMQPDRIGAVGGAGSEQALLRPRHVASRMHPQDVAARTVEPGEDDDLVPARIPSRASSTAGSKASHASGAPSSRRPPGGAGVAALRRLVDAGAHPRQGRRGGRRADRRERQLVVPGADVGRLRFPRTRTGPPVGRARWFRGGLVLCPRVR
jgi:hypothetical protein